MTSRQQARQRAGLPQTAAAYRAGVSPTTCRAFERHGPDGVPDESKRARLVALYDALQATAANASTRTR